MKKILLALAACVCGFSSVAQAQSTDVSWDGRYVALSFGYVGGTSNHSWVGTPAGVDVDVEGITLGLAYGQNFQRGKYVFGYEMGLNASNADGYVLGGTTPCITPGEACLNKLSGVATVKGRAAMPLQNGFMPYMTAGLAMGKIQATADTGACAGLPCSLNEFLAGWTLGLGVEKMLNNGWSLKADYSHMDFGSHLLDGSMPGSNVRGEFKYDLLTVGISRHF